MTLYFPSLPGLDIALSRDIGNFSTVTQESVTGKKTFFPTITQPRYTYTLDVNALWAGAIDTGMGAASLQALVGFYNQCYGSALSFQFTDPDDGAVSAQPFGTGDGATTAFQLVRGLGGFVESVYAPTGTPQIYVGGVLKTAGTDYTINAQSGVVTFATAPASGAALTWTGTFNWWCNWVDDKITVSRILSGIYEAKKLSFMTRIF